MISIIIPAYNEAVVIGRCLRSLTQRSVPGGLEIIVICNGCSDETAKIAQGFGPSVRVLETEQASKTIALNLGDQCAKGFPRVFLDADVEVSLDTIEKVAALLGCGKIMAAAPSMSVELADASWLVKAFYSVWLRQSYHGPGMVGGGFYAVSKQGRQKFDHFPSIIADDEFVRAHFSPAQRATAADCIFTIHAPRTLADLIRIKTRSRLGSYELRLRFPHLAANSRMKGKARWKGLMLGPSLWLATVVYLYVNIVTRFRARSQLNTIHSYRWERDDSSRQKRLRTPI